MDQVSNVVLRLEAEVTQLKNCLLREQLQGTGGRGGLRTAACFLPDFLKEFVCKNQWLS
jgi:hypothetical protein